MIKPFEYEVQEHMDETKPKTRYFVTVLDEFAHHFNGLKFYYVRLEWMFEEPWNLPRVDYRLWNEETMAKAVSTAITQIEQED